MSELSLDLLQFEEKFMKCRPIFDMPLQSQSQRDTLEMLAPDRTIGVVAAYEYLQHHVTKVNTSIAIPAIGILIIALLFAVVSWAVR